MRRAAMILALVILSSCACGGGRPTSRAAASSDPPAPDETPALATPPEEAPTPAPAPAPAGPELALLCGRATARLPEGWRETDSAPCDGISRGVLGMSASSTLDREGCTVRLVVEETVPREFPRDRSEMRIERREETLRVTTSEGSVISIETSDAEGCAGADEIFPALEASFVLAPPAPSAVLVHSSSGHRFELALPPGWVVSSMPGMLDVFESYFRIEPPEPLRGSAVLISAWDFDADPSTPASRAPRPALAPRARAYLDSDPFTESPCIRYRANAETRLAVGLLICPPEDVANELMPASDDGVFTVAELRPHVDEAAILEVVRQGRFLPPP